MTPIEYARRDAVAVITMDDGKVNALGPPMLVALGAAFDRAERDDARAVVLAGRPGRFSAGFDLRVLNAGGPDAEGMLRSGFRLAERLLRFPQPVVIACTGHALAMGAFLLCSGDHRVGAAGDFAIQANEVAIGLTMPLAGLAILRHRLTPSAFDRAVGLAERFTPETAAPAGFLDEVVAADVVVARACELAGSLTRLDPVAHVGTKLRARANVLADIAAGIVDELDRS